MVRIHAEPEATLQISEVGRQSLKVITVLARLVVCAVTVNLEVYLGHPSLAGHSLRFLIGYRCGSGLSRDVK